MKLPITKPVFDQEELSMITRTLNSGWLVQGPYVREFEEAVANYCEVKHAVATTSCTTALHLGLIALGVQPGEEVLLPSFTYIATANAIEYCGARPVFCDIDLRTFLLSEEEIEKRITKNTRGILPVSLFGYPLNYSKLNDLADRYDLWLLEDAACALGTMRHNIHVGKQAHAAAFSFHPRKVITTGEGGMLVTKDDHLADYARSLRNHGAAQSDYERHEKDGSLLPDFPHLGYNYRMTDIQGALGVAQMKKLDSFLYERRQRAAWYDEALRDFDWLCFPSCEEGVCPNFQSYVILLSPGDQSLPRRSDLHEYNQKRNQLAHWLEGQGIFVRQGTHAVHTLSYYREKYSLKDNDFPQSLLADHLSLALPLFSTMSQSDVDYVANKLQEGWDTISLS